MTKQYFNARALSLILILSTCCSPTQAFGNRIIKVLTTIVCFQQLHIHHPEVTKPFIDFGKSTMNELSDALTTKLPSNPAGCLIEDNEKLQSEINKFFNDPKNDDTNTKE